ncbi:hypothetical protein [Lacticaseibacillus paracasei]|uniref:lipopolysaccharide biosynthesis protein n=1 Tax=Lacticaseibacillus paracasei TaxID=1597 RepID=UPI0031F4EAEE
MNSNQERLKRGIISVLIANVINMVMNLMTNFLLPKYLSIDSYAAIKTYQLYASYAGLISLGFVDGMFLKYGGLSFRKLDKHDLDLNLSSFRIFQVVSTVVLVVVGLFYHSTIYWAFALTVLPVNMAGYFQTLYQSIGEFGSYSRIMNATTGVTFIINMTLLFVFRTDTYQAYLGLYVALDIVVWILLEVFLRRKSAYRFTYIQFSFHETIENIKDGILLMLGNFSNSLLTSMDRWFIKFLMNTVAFAQYSFACSMENFVNVAVTPITVTMYNYFCTEKSHTQIKKVRNVVLLFASLLIACAFPGKFILETYLQKYSQATSVMFYLFDAQLFYILIKSVYVNLYKAQRKQTRYFLELIVVVAAGFIFNIICWLLFHVKESFAIGNLLAAIFWFVLCIRDFRWLKYDFREISFIIISSVSFLVLGTTLGSIVGGILYLCIIGVTSFILLRKDTIYLIDVILSSLHIKR